jgi:ligand-binding SRPBCC domain-containing protein
MKIHTLERTQRVPIGIEEAWAFFSDPRNLPRITPPHMGFEITSPLPPRMHAGMIITYRVRPVLGIPVTWVTEISHVEEGRYFVDEQRFGPYRFWHHQHHFREIEGGTEMRDLINYALPFDPAARLAQRWMVAPQLQQIFDFRHRMLEALFGPYVEPAPVLAGRAAGPRRTTNGRGRI